MFPESYLVQRIPFPAWCPNRYASMTQNFYVSSILDDLILFNIDVGCQVCPAALARRRGSQSSASSPFLSGYGRQAGLRTHRLCCKRPCAVSPSPHFNIKGSNKSFNRRAGNHECGFPLLLWAAWGDMSDSHNLSYDYFTSRIIPRHSGILWHAIYI